MAVVQSQEAVAVTTETYRSIGLCVVGVGL